jgi:DNA-3-methyladenine glycosylase
VSPRRFVRTFFARAATDVAPAILGAHLVRRLPDGELLRVRIVETEAYGPEDPASHAFGGPTRRNATMFGDAGHLYVYLVYGLHHCLNVVTDGPGRGSAVLLRAAEPLQGLEGRDACRGPGRLARALGVDLALDGADLTRGEEVWLERGERPASVAAGPRVGITKAAGRPWRYVIEGDPWVSRAATAGRVGSRR